MTLPKNDSYINILVITIDLNKLNHFTSFLHPNQIIYPISDIFNNIPIIIIDLDKNSIGINIININSNIFCLFFYINKFLAFLILKTIRLIKIKKHTT